MKQCRIVFLLLTIWMIFAVPRAFAGEDSESCWHRNRIALIVTGSVVGAGLLGTGLYFLIDYFKSKAEEDFAPPPFSLQSNLSAAFDFTGLQLSAPEAALELFRMMQSLATASPASLVNMLGTLFMTNQDTQVTKTYADWPISINTHNWQVSSAKTIIIDPGKYDLAFLFSDNTT